jgi:hypothetical protein
MRVLVSGRLQPLRIGHASTQVRVMNLEQTDEETLERGM